MRVRSSSLILWAAAACTVAAVLLSTAHLTQFPYGTVVLPWNFPLWVIVPFVASGILLPVAIVMRPEWFWPVLMCSAVFSSGMFVLRFAILDSWLVGWVTVGGIITGAVGAVPVRRSQSNRVWTNLLLALGLYLVVESFVGFVAYENPKALRFAAVFAVVMVIGYLLARYEFPRPSAERITWLICASAIAYYVLYLVHGLIFQQYVFLEILWGIGFAGAANQNVAAVVGMPAAWLMIGSKRLRDRLMGGLLFALVLIVVALSDSRGGMFAILGASLVAPFAIGMKRGAKTLALAAVAALVLGWSVLGNPRWILDVAEATVGGVNVQGGNLEYNYHGVDVVAAKGDAGRFLYLLGGFEYLMDQGPARAMVGAGVYGYFPEAGLYYERVAEERGVPTLRYTFSGASLGGITEPPRPPAMGALIAETGIIGVGLLLACALAALSQTVLRPALNGLGLVLGGPNLLVATCVLLAIGWTYFAECQNILMLYLLILPQGLVHSWVHDSRSDRVLALPELGTPGSSTRTPHLDLAPGSR